MANTTFLQLRLAELEGFTLADLIALLNENFGKIDTHNHTQAREIPISSVVANASLNFNSNAVLNTEFITFLNNSVSISRNASIYFKDGELYVRDSSGREIQITHQGGQAVNVPGNARGNLWLSAPIKSGTTRTGDTINDNWVASADNPSSVTIQDGHTIVFPGDPPDLSVLGIWAVMKVGDAVIEAIFMPWGAIEGTNTYTAKLSNANNYLALNFLKQKSSGQTRLTLTATADSGSVVANSSIEIYPAVVRGARGQQGPVGPVGNIDYTLPAINPQEDFVIPAQERPVNTTNITTGAVEAGWGDFGWSVQPGATAGGITQPLGDGIVLISNTRIAYASTEDRRVKNIYIGDREYSVNWLARNGILGGTEVIYSELNDPLPAGPWNELKLEFTDGSYDPAVSGDDNLRAGTLDKKVLHDLLDVKGIAPTQENIYSPTKEIVKAGANITITPDDDADTLTIAGADVSVDTPQQIKDKLEGLQGTARLDASAVQNLPDPTQAETGASIKGKLEGLAGNDRLDASAIKDLPDSPTETGETIKAKLEALHGTGRLDGSAVKDAQFIGLDETPTDLSQYANGEVFWINNPDPGRFIEIIGANDRHSFAVDFLADPANPNIANILVGSDFQFGVSFTTSRYGELYTAEGGRAFTPTNTLIRSMVVELDTTVAPAPGIPAEFNTSVTMTIPKDKLAVAPAKVWVRYYSGPPASDNQVGTVEFNRSADNPQHDYHTYINAQTNPITDNIQDIESIRYFNLFTASPNTGDQQSNPLNLHGAKSLKTINDPSSGGGTPGTPGSLSAQASTWTPSLAQGTWATEQTISIASKVANTNQGITVTGGNTLNFSKSGFYILEGSFYIESNTPAGQSNNSRSFPEFYFKKNGAKDISSDASFYVRGSGTYLGTEGTSDHSYKITHALACDAGDTVTFHAIAKSQRVAQTALLLNASQSEFKIVSAEGAQGQPGPKGDPGAPGTPGRDGVAGIQKTPRRVTAIPAVDQTDEGEWFYVSDDYEKDNGVYVTPQNFAGTELDSVTNPQVHAGVGNRGWYAKEDAGFQFGLLHPAIDSNFVLISDTRVYVKRNTLTNLAKILVGEQEFTLTRVPQPAGTKLINDPALAHGEPDIDYYTIGGPGLSPGAWNDLRFETTTAGTFIPASVSVTKGLYQKLNGSIAPGGFNATEVQPNQNFKLRVEEEKAGARADKNLAFVASGTTFTNTNPFPGVLRITFNNGSADTDTYNRFTTFVDLEGGSPSNIPGKLKIGTDFYAFHYFETDAGQAVYRTDVVDTDHRVTTARTVNSMNVQWQGGVYAGQSGETKALRTLDKKTLQGIANAVTPVVSVPANPAVGMRIEPLENITVRGGAILTAQASTTGLFTGFGRATIVTEGQIGTLVPDNTNIVGLQSFANRRGAGNEANTTSLTVLRAYTPKAVSINGVNYTLGAIRNVQYYPLNGLNGAFLTANQRYLVNVQNTADAWLYPDVTLQQGRIYTFDGVQWVEEAVGLTQDQVDNRIAEKVQDFAEDGNTDIIPASKIVREISQADFDALAQKEDILYGIP